MPPVSVAEAKNTLPRLIDRAIAGETIVISRRGEPVVELRAVPSSIRSLDPERRRAVYDEIRRGLAEQTPTGRTSVQLLDEMYEDDG